MDALRPLSLDQFAAMTAEMEAGFQRDRVLGDAAVSPEQWELTQETWLLRMAKQGSQRKLALLDRYNELLAKHRKAAQRKMRAEKRKLKGPLPVPAEAHLSPLARLRDDGTGATFQKPAFSESAERAGFVAATPLPVALPLPAAPPPVAPGAAARPAWLSATAPAAAPPEAAAELAPGPAITGPAWLQAPRPAAAPAAPSDRPPPPGAIAGPAWLSGKAAPRAEEHPRSAPPPAPPTAAAARRRLGGTLHEAAPSAQPAGPAWMAAAAQAPKEAPPARSSSMAALPFQKSAAAAQAPSPAAQDALPFQKAASASQAPPPVAQDALPFQKSAAAPPPASAPAAQDALPFQKAASASQAPAPAAAPAPARPSSMNALPFQKAAAAPAPAQSAQPAKQAAAPAGPRLSLEQLAWLQAQMDASPEVGRSAREQLNLSEADYAAERAFWQSRFQQDRATVDRYSQLFYHYRSGR